MALSSRMVIMVISLYTPDDFDDFQWFLLLSYQDFCHLGTTG